MNNSFADLGISTPILNALSNLKIVAPTEIQQKTIPLLLANATDIVGLGPSGRKVAVIGDPICLQSPPARPIRDR